MTRRARPKYGRVLLKLSGEVLMGAREGGIDPATVASVGGQIGEVAKMGVQTAVVVGGGNIFRGIQAASAGMDRVTADYMGMLATVINSLALQEYLEKIGHFTRVMSAIEMNRVCEPFIRRRAVRHLEKGRIVIFAGGTGSPYFSTDTAAALRAVEIGADVLLKGTKVDGVYDSDPMVNKRAVRYQKLTHTELLRKNLRVMDATAASLCRENRLPVVVFNIHRKGNLKKIILGERIGTLVS